MKRRLIKKWEKRGILADMIRKQLARKGKLNSDNDPTHTCKWKPHYLGESVVANAYSKLQSVSPTNPLLKYGTLNEFNHFEIAPKFYNEQFPGENDVHLPTAVLRYVILLRNEYDKISANPAQPTNQHSTLDVLL